MLKYVGFTKIFSTYRRLQPRRLLPKRRYRCRLKLLLCCSVASKISYFASNKSTFWKQLLVPYDTYQPGTFPASLQPSSARLKDRRDLMLWFLFSTNNHRNTRNICAKPTRASILTCGSRNANGAKCKHFNFNWKLS